MRPVRPFASADDALRWVRAKAGDETASPKSAYRAAARVVHPDVAADAEDWARLDEARRLLADSGLLL